MLLGVDIGTTAVKVAAFDRRTGALRAAAARRLRVAVDGDGRREQVPLSLARAIGRSVHEIRRLVGSLAEVRGVGLAAQGGSTIIADRATGKALTPMMLWNDTRAMTVFQTIAAAKPRRYWRSFSLRDEPGIGLARIEWLRRCAPDLIQERNIYVGAGEYIYYWLTGRWRQDPCNALQIGCYDAVRQRLTGKSLALVDVPLSFFAPLREGHPTHPLGRVAAKRLGLPAGIPVAGPYMDHEAGFLSALRASRAPLQCSLGTAWVGNFQLPKESTGRSPFQLVIPAPVGDGTLVIQPLLTGNVTWDWALRTLVSRTYRRALDRQSRVFAESILPPPGLVALPWLNRPNPFQPDTNGGCCFVGVGPSTTKDDLLRAVAAGMAYELARVFDEAKRRAAFDHVVLSGGASKGAHFRQLIGALFEPVPVQQIVDEDWMGTRGCLVPFGNKISQARTRRVAGSRNLDRETLRGGQLLYQTAFDRLYGNQLAGQPFHFGRKRVPR